MKRRTQPQFYSDSDRERIEERDFVIRCLKAIGLFLLIIGLLLLIGYTGAHGQEIDDTLNQIAK